MNSLEGGAGWSGPPRGGLAEQELAGSLSWLIGLRWLAGAGVLLGAWAVGRLDLPIWEVDSLSTPLYRLGLGLLAYNALLWLALRALKARPGAGSRAYQWFARLQIGLDWLATALLVHLTGGIASPALFFFLFHIIIAAMLLPHDRGFVYVALAPILVGAIALLQAAELVPHQPLYGGTTGCRITYTLYDDPTYVTSAWLFFTVACYALAYLSITVSRRLRRREDQLAALYRTLQTTTSTLELPQVLDRLAEATARTLHCQGAAIRLLDKSGSYLQLAGAYGLSPEYRAKPAVEVARAPIDQEALSGRTVLIPDVARDGRLRYLEQAAAEGIHTILSAPLPGKGGPIGVLRAYGGAAQHFSQDDANFLSAIAAQGAATIENAQTYQMLDDLDKSKSRFVRMVTHELRSPVNVASSLLAVLDRGYVGDLNDKQADLVGRARRRIHFLQTLIDDLLDLAAGKAEVLASAERGPVSLREVVEAVAARFAAPAREKGLDLRLVLPGAPGSGDDEGLAPDGARGLALDGARGLTVWGDRGELDRIVNNLVSNAIKYTRQGSVELQLARVEGAARLVVRDSGIGIPAEALPNLFQEFFRAGNAKEVEEAGTGLGLSIVKDLVERYGGEIAVESSEGQGTTFTLTLPLTK